MCGEAGPIRLLQRGRDVGAASPTRVGVEQTCGWAIRSPDFSKLDWVLERPSFVYRGVAGPEPKTVSGP